MMIALTIFTILALALTKTLTFSKFIAEDNLYEATALTVANSLVEQIKGTTMERLIAPPVANGREQFEMLAAGVAGNFLILDEYNDLDVPIVTDEAGAETKRLNVRVRPSITRMGGGDGFWIQVDYEYAHPRSGRTRSYTIRNARSMVSSL